MTWNVYFWCSIRSMHAHFCASRLLIGTAYSYFVCITQRHVKYTSGTLLKTLSQLGSDRKQQLFAVTQSVSGKAQKRHIPIFLILLILTWNRHGTSKRSPFPVCCPCRSVTASHFWVLHQEIRNRSPSPCSALLMPTKSSCKLSEKCD